MVFQGAAAAGLRSGTFRFGARLRPGAHRVPLAGGPPFVVEVAEGAAAGGVIEIGAPPGGRGGKPVVRSVRVEFSPPLRLPNVVDALVEVRRLVGPGGDGGGFETLAGTNPGEVFLSGVSARPRWSSLRGQWELAAGWSGHVRILDRVTYPFWDVVLPSQVLPHLHASLDRLASPEPVATARVRGDLVRPLAVARVLLDALADADADVSAGFDPPAIVADAVLGDLTRLHADGALTGGVEVSGRVSVRRTDDGVEVEARGLSVAGEGGRATADLDAALRIDLETPGLAPARRVTGTARASVARGSLLPGARLTGRTTHPLAPGGTAVEVRIKEVKLHGTVAAAWDGERIHLDEWPASLPPRGGRTGTSCSFSAAFALPEQDLLRRAGGGLWCAVTGGVVRGSIARSGRGTWKVEFEADAGVAQRLEARVSPIPELRIEDDVLRTCVEARISARGGGTVRVRGGGLDGLVVTPSGTVEILLRHAEAELDRRRIELPGGTTLRGRWSGGEVSTSSPAELSLDLAWDLHGKPCLLHGEGRSVSLLTDALRKGDLTLLVGAGGRLRFTGGREGLYGARFFNALIDPARDSEQLLELLRSDDAMSHVSAALGMFDPEIAARFEDLRAFATRLRDHLNAVGVAAVGDAIPRPVLARLLSRLIAGDESIETGLVPLIRDVTEGRGMDLCAAKSLLRAAIGDRRLDYEIDGLMRWVDLVTRPSEPLARAAAVEEPPLVDDPRYAEAIAGLPSAADIYRAVEKEAVPAATPERVAELAPYLTLGQIDHVLDGAEAKWPAAAVARLRRVRDVKRKVARIDEAEWGVALGAQAVRVGAFIGEAVGPLPGVDEAAPECALGPRDVAVLLQTGLAEGRQGLQAQINNRLLIELIRSRPGEFLREVLVEMGHQVPRILTGVLWAFLHQDQDELAGPLDLAGLLSEKLGLPVPRQEDYMAGGRKARGSYYEALSKLSDAIFAGAGPYLARRARLREVRHEVPPWPRPEGSSARLESEAIAAVTAADALGAKCSFDGADGAAHRRARAAYRTAFEACAALLREVPDGFQLPWLREFWSRNEEALKVLSVVRNWQEDVDDVRHWLAVVSGRPVRRAEQALVETVVRCLYACPEDRDALAADPLVRLLLDPEPGPWAFTVVSCMGVVTEGREGHELDETYRRLAERRGVRVVRAHTGLFRSLEHNAAAILKEVRGIRGDWGYVGYSQGCANALVAESFLRGGTPEEQRLLGGLRCRNLLFSAANGSVHGTSGALKFTRAMVEGERFLKHYQASHSREVVSIALRAMRTVMDSRAFLNALGGTFSLSLERARALHREGQFLPWVPTSTTRGAVTPDRLAEALEYLWYCHEGLLPGAPHDSQVPAEEAVGHATRIRNCRTEVLARCDMGSRVQATHHWSPLTTEIEFVTTDRDRARAVYLSPKDRHVFPWLEVNARFGRIG